MLYKMGILVVHWLGLCSLTAKGKRVQSLLKELRSHKPCGTAQNKIKVKCQFCDMCITTIYKS